MEAILTCNRNENPNDSFFHEEDYTNDTFFEKEYQSCILNATEQRLTTVSKKKHEIIIPPFQKSSFDESKADETFIFKRRQKIVVINNVNLGQNIAEKFINRPCFLLIVFQ